MSVVSWLRQFVLRDHAREHEVVERRLSAEEDALLALEIRLRRLEIDERLRSRRALREQR